MEAEERPAQVMLVVHSAKRQGAQAVALSHARTLAVDYDLTIAIGDGPLRTEFAELGRLLHTPSRLPIWGASRARWGLDLAKVLPDVHRLVRAIRQYGVEAIVAGSTVLVAPVLAARLAGVPVIVWAHEAPTTPAARRLFGFHAELADTVMAISPWVAEAFAGARANVIVSWPGIPIPPWRERGERAADAALRMLLVGTIDEHKRQDLALDALALLRDARIDAELELVGPVASDGYARNLQKLADDLGVAGQLRFAGERGDVTELMRAADIVLVPAGEVTPLVLMESMAVGTPVVAARMGSIPDVVQDGDSGLLFPPGDAVAMAQAIRRIRDSPALAGALSRGGRARVVDRFDVGYSAQALHAELERLIALRRGRRPPPSEPGGPAA